MEKIKTFATLSKKLNHYNDLADGKLKLRCILYCDSIRIHIQIGDIDEAFICFSAGKPSLYDALYLITCTYNSSIK